MSFANSELLPGLGGWFRPLIGRDPYNKKSVDDSQKRTAANIKVLSDHLLINTYLVSERLTLADIFLASIITRGYEHFFDAEWRKENPSVHRWYETVVNQEIFKSVAGEAKFIDKAIPNVPPKKEKEEKPKQEPKKQEKKKEVDPEEDDEPAAAPKAKHPLEALPKASFVLDDW